MTHISVLFIYYITSFFVQGMQHTTELAKPLLYHVTKTQKVSSKRMVSLCFFPNLLIPSRNNIFYSPPPPNQYVVIGYTLFEKNNKI